MHHWTKGIMGDDPAYLAVGTEVSAKYKGAFCEAKVRKVVRSVKCKVTFKLGLGSSIVTDDQVRGTLRVGSVCEVKHPEKKEFVEATINKITDSSQYTVVFDDGDITTLRRTALCLKSGRHFAVSETLDQLPLTHPEHFSNPVVGGRKGRRSRQAHEDSSDEEETTRRSGSKKKEEKEADIGRVVCVELGDKKKQKDNWFPGLVVAPTAQDTVRIRVKDEYLVRSFRDGRYFTVPKKEATEFTREIGSKVDNNTLKAAVEKALLFLDRDELPPHWDRDVLFGTDESSAVSDSDAGLESDSSDDEPREEKDHFVAQLYKFMDDRGTPINNEPTICNKDIDLYKLFKVVHKLGGYNRVTNHNQWKTIARKVGFDQSGPSIKNLVKQAYKKFLHSFEEFYRKLGCTMVNHPRHGRPRHHGGRSLIRDRDRATPVNTPKEKDTKAGSSTTDSVPETPDLPEKRDTVITPVAEAGRSKAEESKLTVKEVRVEDKTSADKDKSSAKDESSGSEKVVKKDKDVRKEREAKKETKKEKEILKKEKDLKKEKVVVVDVKLKSIDLPKDVAKTPLVKEPEPKEDITPVKTIDKEASEDSAAKTSSSARREVKPKDDKGKKVRECKRQYGRQQKKEVEEVAAPAAAEKVKEECVEEAISLKDEEKEESAKMSEDEKSDDSKRAVESLPHRREEAVTRSKSREDLKPESAALAERRRSRDFDKPIAPRPRRLEEEDEAKKRGRKRKDTDSKQNPEEVLGQLGVGIGVGVGDKLKVYYGPTHESKVTYEAKVIEVEKETYLVHYTGWNTRYDEWIRRGRIAENLSWTPSRAKRLKLQLAKAGAKSAQALGRRGRPATTGREIQRARSTTPSSVTSSSSRTKSPGTPAPTPRQSRPPPPPGAEYRRRTRRMSGHTDLSVASEASGSESDDYTSEAEVEVEPTRTRSRSERIGVDKDEGVAGKVEGKRSSLRRRTTPRKEEGEGEAEEDTEEEGGAEQRRSTRSRKPPPHATAVPTTPEVKREAESDEEPQPKGRDFDLNQIRSELKGIEKAVKPPQEVALPGVEEKEPPPILDDKTGLIDSQTATEKEAVVAKVMEPAGKSSSSSTDDIYEFKEPEPFEFEVRAKRELSLPEERAKSSRKSGGAKVAEPEVVTPKPEKTPPSRKKLVRNASKSETKEVPVVAVKETPVVVPTAPAAVVPAAEVVPAAVVPADVTVKKRFRRTVGGKKASPAPAPAPAVAETKKEPVAPSPADPTTPQKTAPTSACEDAFNKLCESPVFRPAAPRRTPSPGEPLSLFAELPGGLLGRGGDCEEDDTEDRLVISETDDCETEPLFTYSQRHHEELLPTLAAVVASSVVTLPPPLNLVEKPISLQQAGAGIVTSSFQKGPEAPAPAGKSSPVKSPSPRRSGVKSPSIAKCPSPRVNSPGVVVKSPALSVKSPVLGVKNPVLSVKSSVLSVKGPSPSLGVKSPVLGVKGAGLGVKGAGLGVKSPGLSVKSSPSSSIIPAVKAITPSISSPSVKSPGTVNVATPSISVAATKALPVLAKKEVAAVVAKAKEETVTAVAAKAATIRPITDDVIAALLLKESGDEFEDDPISAAIQRVISQSVAKEDNTPEKSVAAAVKSVKPAEQLQPESKATKIEAPSPTAAEHQKRDALKRKSGGRKPVLSREFVEDSDDSDSSSDEEPRLVIDRVDDDDSLSQQDEESLLAESLSKHSAFEKAKPSASAPLGVEEKKVVSKEDSVLVAPQDTSKPHAGSPGKAGKRVLEKKPRLEDVKESAPLATRTEEPVRFFFVSVPKDDRKTPVELKITPKPDLAISIQAPTIEPKPMTIRTTETEDTKEDLENDLSLLCEETIPGSPTPAQDPTDLEEATLVVEQVATPLEMTKSLFLEMPFASVPGTSIVASAPCPKPAEAMEAALKVLAKPQLVGSQAGPANRKVDEAAAVLENTPPTTPESSITSNSPREERAGLSPTTLDTESFKMEDSSVEAPPRRVDHYSEEDSLLNIEVSNSSDAVSCPKKPPPPPHRPQPPRVRKRSECGDAAKRLKLTPGRAAVAAVRGGAATDSDDDDTSENSVAGCVPLSSSENILLLASRSPRPSRYNFYVELDPELDGSQRIALLQQKLQDLRKTYLNVKSELAGIDRRRKKLRRREREEKATKQEVACS